MKAIYWSERGKALAYSSISLLLFLSLFILPFFIKDRNLMIVIAAIIALLIFTFINLYHYHARERYVIFDDDNETLVVNYGNPVLWVRLLSPVFSPFTVGIGDVFDSVSYRSGKKSIAYSEIEHVYVLSTEEGRMIEIGYKGPWDTTLRVKLYEKEMGEDKLREMAEEFKKRVKGEGYEYEFRDEVGVTESAYFNPDTLPDNSVPYDVK